MSDAIFLKESENETTTNNQKLKNTFSDIPAKGQASCNAATHIAILPIRIAIDDFDCQGGRACKYVGHFISLTTCHYTLKQLVNGWLYVHEEKHNAVFEYEVKEHDFIQHGIFPYDVHEPIESKFIKLNETTEILPYIRCSMDSKITLFYSRAKASKALRESWVSLSSSTWSKNIDIPTYYKTHKDLPKKNWKDILATNGCIDKIDCINKKIDSEHYSPQNKEFYDDLSSLIKSLNDAEIPLKIINKLSNYKEKINYYSSTDSSENNNNMYSPKENIALPKDLENPAEKEFKIKRDGKFYENLLEVKTLLEEIRNLNTIYVDGTMPLQQLYRVEDINASESSDIDSTEKISRSQIILNKLDDDIKIKGQPLNMLAIVGDAIGIIEDLTLNLKNYNYELKGYNEDVAYKKVIAESCLQLLYPTISTNASIKNTRPLHTLNYDDIIEEHNPFTYYDNLPEPTKFRQNNIENKNYDMLKEKELFNFLKEYEHKQYKNYAREKDLVMWLNYCNKRDGRNNFLSSIGFDLEESDQHEFLLRLFKSILEALSLTDEGKEWVSNDFENKGILSGILWAFDKKLEDTIKAYLKDNGFDCTNSTVPKTSPKNSSLDSAIMINRQRDAVFKIIDTETFQKSKFNNFIKGKTKIVFDRLLQNNTFKNLYMSAFILLGNTLNPVRFINKANALLPYATLYTITNAGIAMKLNPNFDTEFKDWLKTQGAELKSIQKLKTFVYSNKVTGNNSYGAKQQEEDLLKKENRHARKAQSKAKELTYTTRPYIQTHSHFARKDSLPPVDAYSIEYQGKLKLTDIGICIDLILSVWQVASALQTAGNKENFTADDYLDFSVPLINFITSSANAVVLKLKTIDLTRLESELMAASGNSTIYASDKLAKLNSKINAWKLVSNGAGFVLSALYTVQYIRQASKTSNHAEFAWVGVSVGCSIMATCLGFAAIFGAECPPLAIAFAVIGIAADILAGYFHRTDFQLWLEHCRWGQKYSLANYKDDWCFYDLKEELNVLYHLISTPNVVLEYQTPTDETYPIEHYRIQAPSSACGGKFSYEYKIENIMLNIAMPLLTVGSMVSFEIYNESNNFSFLDDTELKGAWILSGEGELPIFSIKIPAKAVMRQSLYLVIKLIKKDGESYIITASFIYPFKTQSETINSSSSDGSVLKQNISVLSEIDQKLHKPKASSPVEMSGSLLLRHNDLVHRTQ